MPDRDALIAAFAHRAGWGTALRRPLAGDASNRRYLRLLRDSGETAVLMDAPPERGEDVRPFIAIATHLSALGLSAPAILAEDAPAGLLLLEDLGDDLFARLAVDPARETPLYLAAAEVLAALHSAPPPSGLVRFTPETMADLVRLVFDWYAPGTPDRAAEEIVGRLRDVLEARAPDPTVLSLRDFHAENLLWLPGRAGPARVGLLDFQDAVIAHPAYDLVSLLHDARRDVTGETRAATLRHFLDLTGQAEESFVAAAAALSTQRNLRILGVFARLAGRDGKTGYLRFLPRVWSLLLRDLDHPDLARLRKAALSVLPSPDNVRPEAPCPTP
jgi:aminoglycoside/choline kinase family phosphotransferase